MMDLGESEVTDGVVRTSEVEASGFACVLVRRGLPHRIHRDNICEKHESVLGSCDCGAMVRGGRSSHRVEFARVRFEVPRS